MNKDFGIEAIETIIATIKGGETTVGDRSAYIIAGYPGDITRFPEANQGLRRRVTDISIFDNYSSNNLFEICVEIAT